MTGEYSIKVYVVLERNLDMTNPYFYDKKIVQVKRDMNDYIRPVCVSRLLYSDGCNFSYEPYFDFLKACREHYNLSEKKK